jgi:hypothetical protein
VNTHVTNLGQDRHSQASQLLSLNAKTRLEIELQSRQLPLERIGLNAKSEKQNFTANNSNEEYLHAKSELMRRDIGCSRLHWLARKLPGMYLRKLMSHTSKRGTKGLEEHTQSTT